jgi:hypothetical protein
MAITWKEMVKAATLTGTSVSLYTAPALASGTIQAATVYNSTGAAIQVNIYKVPPGLAADATTMICTRSVPAGAVVQANEAINHKLQSGTQIFASGAGLTLNVSGVEYVPE